MTWAEFQIRLFAYKRMDLYDNMWKRELMCVTYIAPYQDPKRMVKSKNAFLRLDGEKETIGVSDEAKDMFLKEMEQYQQIIKSKA